MAHVHSYCGHDFVDTY